MPTKPRWGRERSVSNARRARTLPAEPTSSRPYVTGWKAMDRRQRRKNARQGAERDGYRNEGAVECAGEGRCRPRLAQLLRAKFGRHSPTVACGSAKSPLTAGRYRVRWGRSRDSMRRRPCLSFSPYGWVTRPTGSGAETRRSAIGSRELLVIQYIDSLLKGLLITQVAGLTAQRVGFRPPDADWRGGLGNNPGVQALTRTWSTSRRTVRCGRTQFIARSATASRSTLAHQSGSVSTTS